MNAVKSMFTGRAVVIAVPFLFLLLFFLAPFLIEIGRASCRERV